MKRITSSVYVKALVKYTEIVNAAAQEAIKLPDDATQEEIDAVIDGGMARIREAELEYKTIESAYKNVN